MLNVGWNDDVLKDLLSCYVNVPKARDHEMSPYLGEEQIVANIDDVKRRYIKISKFICCYLLICYHFSC